MEDRGCVCGRKYNINLSSTNAILSFTWNESRKISIFPARKKGGYVEARLTHISATHTRTYKGWKIPGSYESIRTSMDLYTAVACHCSDKRRHFGVAPVDPESATYAYSNDKQALTEFARSPLDILRHN